MSVGRERGRGFVEGRGHDGPCHRGGVEGQGADAVGDAARLLKHHRATVGGDAPRIVAPGGHQQALGAPAPVGRNPPEIVVARVDHAPPVEGPDGLVADAVGREARPHPLAEIEHPHVAAGGDRVGDVDRETTAVGREAGESIPLRLGRERGRLPGP